MDAGASPRTAAGLGLTTPLPRPGGPARLANGVRAVRELYWRACTKGRWRDLRWLDEVQGLATRRGELDHRLALLERTSLFNDGFFIWHAGPFATVNGLRLGRLKTAAVEWEEVNAALGQLAMLVSAVASRISDEFVFQRHARGPRAQRSREGAESWPRRDPLPPRFPGQVPRHSARQLQPHAVQGPGRQVPPVRRAGRAWRGDRSRHDPPRPSSATTRQLLGGRNIHVWTLQLQPRAGDAADLRAGAGGSRGGERPRAGVAPPH